MRIVSAIVLFAFIRIVVTCSDDGMHDHPIYKRARTSIPVTPPSRALEWGDINFLHTTDSHGWLLGHQKPSFPEPNYSADLGDFFSFVKHMKQIAHEKNVDLLLVDSGDLHDGTGLTDGFPPGGIDGHDSNQFYSKLPFDILTIGNHELYVYANTYDMYKNFAPKFPGRYLTSNVNITIFDEHNNVVSVPVGSRFAKFRTTKGRRVTALGVLFDFAGNDKNTTVQRVEDMVKEQWFLEAIQEEPDLFLFVGHMPLQQDNWPLVFNAVRTVHSTTPILIFGGHSHVRDCVQFDGRSMALESGRYMETVGWLSAKLGQPGSATNITFSRRYLDPNRVTYEFHTGRSDHSFDTHTGKGITAGLVQLAAKYNINSQFGTAPQDYFLSRAPFPSSDSSLTLFIDEAIPVALTNNNTRASKAKLIIANSGSQRFDLYKGPFTVNDQLTISPFSDGFLYIPDVPAAAANQVLSSMNQAGANARRAFEEREAGLYMRGYVDMRYNKWLEDMDRRSGAERREAGNMTLGYVTADSCPGIGDDTLHAPLPFFSTPAFIASTPPSVSGDTPIDLVFIDFIETQLLQTLNKVQSARNYTTADVQSYSPILANQVLGIFAQEKWN